MEMVCDVDSSMCKLYTSKYRSNSAGIWIIGTADEAENSIFEEDLTSPTALVMGSEGQGLRQNTRKHCDKLVNIPMAGVVESLNVSVAAGVCLYEAQRQRHHNK